MIGYLPRNRSSLLVEIIAPPSTALVLTTGRWRIGPPPGLLDSAVLALSFWTGVAVFSVLILPALLGVALLAYLVHRRWWLRTYSPGKKAPGAQRV
jgi:hypothetical protein